MMTPNKRALVVDDEFLNVDIFSAMLEAIGLDICGSAANAHEAIRLAKEYQPRLVLMDVRLKGVEDGVFAAAAIHAAVGSLVIYITGSREPQTIERIARLHPAQVLFKPVHGSHLRTVVTSALGW